MNVCKLKRILFRHPRPFTCLIPIIQGQRLHHQSSESKGLGENLQKKHLLLKNDRFQTEFKRDQSNSSQHAKADGSNEQKSLSSMQWSPRSMKIAAGLLTAWAGSVLAFALYEWGSPAYDKDGKPIEDEFSRKYSSAVARVARMIDATLGNYQMIKDPTSDRLLPDPVTYPLYQPKYTLVVEHSGVLVNPEWSYKTGWRYKKRPGLDYFLQKVGYPVFELVIYTEDSAMTAVPILSGLGANDKLFAALFREDTRYRRGTHIKDLSCLNRDLSRIIIVDWNEDSYQLQPRNGIHRLKKWDGEADRTLYQLADFLEMIASSNVNDVRHVLDHYNEEIDPLASFAERQQKVMDMNKEETPRGASNTEQSSRITRFFK